MRAPVAGLALLLAAPAMAQEVRLGAGAYPHVAGEISLGLYGVSTYRAPDRERRYREIFARGEFAAGLHLLEGVSVQGVAKFEPVGEGPGAGQDRAFQDAGAFLESLFLEWRPDERLMLQAGKFTAPFGYGYEAFPGIRLRINAEEAYEVAESLGFGGRVTLLSDRGGWGEHDLSAAVFTLDTSALSSTLITRKRFGRDEAERYRRNARLQGGPGNTGSLDNVALALDGDGIGALPGFSYHLGLLSRGPGVDGTAREWGFAVGARYEIPWSESLRTLLFAEWVRLRNAGGRAVEDVEGEPVAVRERRSFTTLGARTGWGPWRAVLAWQQDERKRGADAVPTGTYLEVSAGRELGFGFAADVGWSRTRYGREEGGVGRADALLGLLSWRAEF